ncbi:MAG: DNA methyltransferase [Candidatus Levyibacteriota bacterium]
MKPLFWITEKRKIKDLVPYELNPRKISEKQAEKLKQSLSKFNLVEIPAIDTKNRIIAGHQRIKLLLLLGRGEEEIDVRAPNRDLSEGEFKEYNIRSNIEAGEWDLDLLGSFDENLLSDVGFTSEEIDEIFDWEDTPEAFDLQKELQKLNITKVNFQKGDIYKLGEHKLMAGDATEEKDILKLADGETFNSCVTDPPYILSYLTGKKRCGEATTGFGLKRDRRYLETESLPGNFTELWMNNIAKIQKPDFSIIVFENPKNLRTIWNELEKHWKYRNTIVWHLPNRVQGFAAKYKFFNKHDIALLGTSGNISLNLDQENELLQNEYENALFATSGSPHWESYGKGKKYCPTDFIEFKASDEKNSGQGIIFGTKPVEIILPYIKVLTKRGDLIIEPFGGSGSTLIAAEKLKRRCFVMEKSPVYCEVIKHRWEKFTGRKAEKIYG